VADSGSNETKLPISLVIITKNEQHNISRCLASVPWASDIVVLDSGSTDQTCDIARKMGARVFVEEWRGYRAQKQRATALARYDWVLSLDADEALSPELSAEIYETFQSRLAPFAGTPRAQHHLLAGSQTNDSYMDLEGAQTSSQNVNKATLCESEKSYIVGSTVSPAGSVNAQEKEERLAATFGAPAFEVPRRSFYMNRWIDHGGWYPDYQIRLFHRKSAQWTQGHVHERVLGSNGERLKNDLHHYPFGSLRKQIETNNEYSSLSARDLYDRGVKFSMFKLLTKPVFKFLECYVWKRGFLDGLPGFIIARGAAYSMFLKWAKLWEIESEQN
jgi:glycosyltransferase involved in cell wall biosynthesis